MSQSQMEKVARRLALAKLREHYTNNLPEARQPRHELIASHTRLKDALRHHRQVQKPYQRQLKELRKLRANLADQQEDLRVIAWNHPALDINTLVIYARRGYEIGKLLFAIRAAEQYCAGLKHALKQEEQHLQAAQLHRHSLLSQLPSHQAVKELSNKELGHLIRHRWPWKGPVGTSDVAVKWERRRRSFFWLLNWEERNAQG